MTDKKKVYANAYNKYGTAAEGKITSETKKRKLTLKDMQDLAVKPFQKGPIDKEGIIKKAQEDFTYHATKESKEDKERSKKLLKSKDKSAKVPKYK